MLNIKLEAAKRAAEIIQEKQQAFNYLNLNAAIDEAIRDFTKRDKTIKVLYMTVTADKFELPLAIEPKLKDLSKSTGIKYHTLRNSFYKNSRIRNTNCKCVKVEI